MNGLHLSSDVEKFTAELRQRAGEYFPEFREVPATVELKRAAARPFSELYEFAVTFGDVTNTTFVKVPFLDKSRPPVDQDRPRLFPPVIPEQMALLEYRAMRQVEQHFAHRDDPRFDRVRVLDLWSQPDAIVMAKASGRSLKALVTQLLKTETELDRSLAIFRHVGAWLQRFHQLPNLEHTTERSVGRADFVDATQRFLEYCMVVKGPRWVQSLGRRLVRESQSTLPPKLPIGLAHGDFAPRNVIVSHGDRITVLDTLARWRAPIYEDIASFLLSFHLQSGIQRLWSGDCPRITQGAAAFLDGYFGDAEQDLPTIRLFVLQALLDRACSYLAARSHDGVISRVKRHCKVQYLRRLAQLQAADHAG